MYYFLSCEFLLRWCERTTEHSLTMKLRYASGHPGQWQGAGLPLIAFVGREPAWGQPFTPSQGRAAVMATFMVSGRNARVALFSWDATKDGSNCLCRDDLLDHFFAFLSIVITIFFFHFVSYGRLAKLYIKPLTSSPLPALIRLLPKKVERRRCQNSILSSRTSSPSFIWMLFTTPTRFVERSCCLIISLIVFHPETTLGILLADVNVEWQLPRVDK